jgi:hypothetical protein
MDEKTKAKTRIEIFRHIRTLHMGHTQFAANESSGANFTRVISLI